MVKKNLTGPLEFHVETLYIMMKVQKAQIRNNQNILNEILEYLMTGEAEHFDTAHELLAPCFRKIYPTSSSGTETEGSQSVIGEPGDLQLRCTPEEPFGKIEPNTDESSD